MSFELAKSYIEKKGYSENIIHFETSTATVELAAKALNVESGQIAKSLSFKDKDGNIIMVVMAGNVVIDNRKYKEYFNFKASMLNLDDVEEKVGHKVGGVCPFGIKNGIAVFMDKSLLRYVEVYPACGDQNNVLRLSVQQLFELSNAKDWIDVSKIREYNK